MFHKGTLGVTQVPRLVSSNVRKSTSTFAP